jgi:hypothetical protein
VSQLKLTFPLTHHFFGLTSKYKEPLLKEIHSCFTYLELTYSEIMSMPTWERRFHINQHSNKIEKEREKQENDEKNKDGKKIISGDILKQKLKTNQIPN